MEDVPLIEKPIVFNNLPKREVLCHVLVSIDPIEKKDKSVKSDYQWQLLKTRLLIFSEENLIATPAAGMLRCIHVAVKKEFLESGVFSAVLQKQRLKIESVGILSFSIYEQCIMYYFIAKLAPQWNKVEKYFVEGRYFLMQRGALHAIELHIIIREQTLMLYASPLRLWLREVSLLDLLPSNIAETVSKPFFVDLHTERQWVHVLPSFKRGLLVYVTNCIPKESTFDDYMEMRRHWKNTYGYRLPEGDSSPIYVGISFFNNNNLLYPLQCVRRGMHMNKDDSTIALNFAKAVAARASVVCGNKLKLLNLAELQNTPKLKMRKRFEWKESTLAEIDSELLNKWLSPCDVQKNITVESQEVSLYTEHSQSDEVNSSLESWPEKKKESEYWLLNCTQFIDDLIKGGQKRSYLKASRPCFNKTSISSMKPDPEIFCTNSLASMKHLENNFLSIEEGSSGVSYKPCFNKLTHSQALTELNSGDEPSSSTLVEKYNFLSSENNFVIDKESTCANNASEPRHSPPLKPVFKKKYQLHTPMKSYKKTQEKSNINVEATPLLYVVKDDLIIKKKSKKKSDNAASSSRGHKKNIVLCADDIEKLAALDQLGKANIPSLCCFLKDKGVPCSKYRKDVLIEKVKHILAVKNEK